METDEMSRLFAAERAVAPPAGSAEASLQRLLSSLAAHAAPLPVAVGSLQLGWSLLGKWIGVGFALGLAAAGAATVASAGHRNEQAHLAPTVATSEAPIAALAQTPTALESSLPSPRAPEPRALPQPPIPSATARAERGPTFDEELKLIAAAKRELDAGQPHLASVWLEEHARRFAGGVFALERDGLVVMARCAQSPSPALAEGFVARYPGSPLREQLRRRCGGPAAPGPLPSASDFPGGIK